MADDPYSLDSLLEDLDEVVVHQNKETEQKSSKFVPHPPARDKFAAHVSIKSFTFVASSFLFSFCSFMI